MMASQYNNFRKTQHFVRRCYTIHCITCLTEEEQLPLDRKSINKVFIIPVMVEKHELFSPKVGMLKSRKIKNTSTIHLILTD